MSTAFKGSNLATVLFGKTRLAVLSLIYSYPDEAFYLQQLARVTSVGLGALRGELKLLTAAGIIQRAVRGKKAYYQANPECPVFTELKCIIARTCGVAETLRDALMPLADRISVAFIYGSVARGEMRSGSDVNVLVVGDVSFDELVDRLGSNQRRLGREIASIVYSPSEFRAGVAERHHFHTRVLGGPRIYLIGDEHELEGLVGKKLAGRG